MVYFASILLFFQLLSCYFFRTHCYKTNAYLKASRVSLPPVIWSVAKPSPPKQSSKSPCTFLWINFFDFLIHPWLRYHFELPRPRPCPQTKVVAYSYSYNKLLLTLLPQLQLQLPVPQLQPTPLPQLQFMLSLFTLFTTSPRTTTKSIGPTFLLRLVV